MAGRDFPLINLLGRATKSIKNYITTLLNFEKNTVVSFLGIVILGRSVYDPFGEIVGLLFARHSIFWILFSPFIFKFFLIMTFTRNEFYGEMSPWIRFWLDPRFSNCLDSRKAFSVLDYNTYFRWYFPLLVYIKFEGFNPVPLIPPALYEEWGYFGSHFFGVFFFMCYNAGSEFFFESFAALCRLAHGRFILLRGSPLLGRVYFRKVDDLVERFLRELDVVFKKEADQGNPCYTKVFFPSLEEWDELIDSLDQSKRNFLIFSKYSCSIEKALALDEMFPFLEIIYLNGGYEEPLSYQVFREISRP